MSRTVLAALLCERAALPLDRLAAALGWPVAEARRRAEEEGVLLEDDSVRWQDATPWLAAAWSPMTLVEMLGPDADLLPPGLHPLPLVLFPPAWVVHALRVQWQLAAPASPFTGYLYELLSDAVDPDTVTALGDDEEFMRAYEFATGGGA
jgi:hypothetical protein